MAELILTEEEKHANNYIDWSDESLGKMVKKLALIIKDEKGTESAINIASCVLLACSVENHNKEGLVIELGGVTNENKKDIGNWKIEIKKID